MNLFEIQDLEVPLGGTTGPAPLSFCRAVWTNPLPGEDDAPDERIVHQRVLQLHNPATIHRLGLRKHRGYHSCGSTVDPDWITALRLFVWEGDDWTEWGHLTDLPRPDGDEVHWIALQGIKTSAIIIELRACGIDNWWPSWNLASGGLILEGDVDEPRAPRKERLIDIGPIDIDNLPEGVAAELLHGELRYRTDVLDVGFCLDRAGFSHFGVNRHGNTSTATNLLRHGPGLFLQGPRMHAVGRAPDVAPTLRNDVGGVFTATGATATYQLVLLDESVSMTLDWTVGVDSLEFRIRRSVREPVRVWGSPAWVLALDCTATPSHVIAKNTRFGQTGVVELPAWIDLPAHGSAFVEVDGPDAASCRIRSDAFRFEDRTEIELRLNEKALETGEYLLPAGDVEAVFRIHFRSPDVAFSDDAPQSVREAVERCLLTSMSYRPDTSTLSNNGASMHCPICMDNWSDIARHAPALLPDLTAMDLVRDSLERWLDGATGYASGNIVQDGKVHAAEDEYLMTGTASLLGLADYLEFGASDEWAKRFEKQIVTKLNRMRKRDLDNDGLIESPFRTGVSGTGQWSTCWFDVVSFGWKDAFSNALLYEALIRLPGLLSARGIELPVLDLDAWASKLRESYNEKLFNPETGWVAGWRCKDDKLHDHAFLTPTGAAICAGLLDEDDARSAMERLWKEAQRRKMPDARYGLPVCLWPIPDKDRADILQGYPFGFYQNGARTHSQSRHFVRALYRVGMKDEADALLDRLCSGLADAIVYGGCRSGKDWRYWDDRPCGYEGLLTDQFGILAVAMERYGAR